MAGFFIVLEGGDGSGKSTQARMLAEALRHRGLDVLLTQEPAGTPLGVLVKGVFERAHSQPGAPQLSPKTELFLFEAARADHVRTVIRPALEAGRVVICDRFADSTLAYQGYGRGLRLDEILKLNEIATEGLAPDLVLVFDVSPEVGIARADRGGEKALDAIGQESLEFHRRVRDGFLGIARAGGERYVVIDAGRPQDQVAAEVLTLVGGLVRQAGRLSG
jgi:dTMP kinase